MRPQVKSRRRCSRSRRSQIRRPQQASMEFRRAASQPPVTGQATRTGFRFRVNATATAGATGWRLRESRQTNNARARRASARYRAMEQRPLAIANVTIRGMIAAAHTILFAEDAERARAFLRDVLGFEGVDAGDGWLIFALPPGETNDLTSWVSVSSILTARSAGDKPHDQAIERASPSWDQLPLVWLS